MNAQTLLTASNIVSFVGAVLLALGTFGNYYFRTQVDDQRMQREERRRNEEVAAALQKERHAQNIKREEQQREDAKAREEAERRRRGAVLSKLHELYVISHDGLSPELLARTAPMPKAWVEEQLKKMGESWTQAQYY